MSRSTPELYSPDRRELRLLGIIGVVLSMLPAACGASDSPSSASSSEATGSVAAPTEAPAAAPVDSEPAAAEAEDGPTPSVSVAASPTNDLLVDAIVVDPTALPFTATADTTSATSDADDERVGCPAPQTDASVWYSLTSSVDMRVVVSGEGSDFPVGISAVSAEPGSLELLECRPFAFEVAIEADRTYVFQVFDGDNASSQGGALAFRIEEVERPSTEGLAPLGLEYLQTVATEVPVTNGAFMFAVADDGEVVVGTNGVDGSGNEPTASDLFRIGSITKVFTSLATLTLVDDGLVDLDAAAGDYVSRVAVPPDVTVRDLLRHTSGIYNYTDADDFFPAVFGDPERAWTPEDVVEVVSEEPPLFEPGSQFSYSNTNYAIVGVLIEEVTGQQYHEVVRERILDPLGLSSTYLAGYEDGPDVFQPYEHLGQSGYDYTSIETGAWAGGAMVSSAGDLHRLFTALFDAEIISSGLVAEMVDGDMYGLGVELGESSEGLYGHSGGIPGYTTFVRHSPESGVTAFLVSTDEAADTSYAVEKLFDGFAALAAG